MPRNGYPVSATDHNFAATQSLHPTPDSMGGVAVTSQRAAQARPELTPVQQRPRTLVGALARLVRPNAAVALTMPVLCGALLAWWEIGLFHPLPLLFNLVSTLTLALGMNALAEHFDYTHAERALRLPETNPQWEPPLTGYGLLVQRLIRPALALNLGYCLLLCSLLCSLWATLLAGWPVLFFSGLSLALAYTHAGPPLRYGDRGWTLGEIGVFLGYGLLPLLGGYFGQSQMLTGLALWTGLPISLLTTLIFLNYNLVYEYRDWLMHKRTLVVNIGAGRALDLSAIMVLALHAGLLCMVSLGYLPLYTLITLAALPTAMSGFSRLRQSSMMVVERFRLYNNTVYAGIWTGLLFCAALLGDKLF